jgi:hypothetical protein
MHLNFKSMIRQTRLLEYLTSTHVSTAWHPTRPYVYVQLMRIMDFFHMGKLTTGEAVEEWEKKDHGNC